MSSNQKWKTVLGGDDNDRGHGTRPWLFSLLPFSILLLIEWDDMVSLFRGLHPNNLYGYTGHKGPADWVDHHMFFFPVVVIGISFFFIKEARMEMIKSYENGASVETAIGQGFCVAWRKNIKLIIPWILGKIIPLFLPFLLGPRIF